jgi:hypothetical protein
VSLDPVPRSADTGQLMAKEETPDVGLGLGEVHVTIVAEPGRVRATLTKFLAGAGVRAAIAFVGLSGAAAAGAIVAVSSSSGRAGRPRDYDALATQFRLRLNCARLTGASPEDAYARIDLDRAGPCGMFGNRTKLIVHRPHGVWLRQSEASDWTCPTVRAPHVAVIALHLCRSNRAASSPGRAVSEIPLDRTAESELIAPLEHLQGPASHRNR